MSGDLVAAVRFHSLLLPLLLLLLLLPLLFLLLPPLLFRLLLLFFLHLLPLLLPLPPQYCCHRVLVSHSGFRVGKRRAMMTMMMTRAAVTAICMRGLELVGRGGGGRGGGRGLRGGGSRRGSGRCGF